MQKEILQLFLVEQLSGTPLECHIDTGVLELTRIQLPDPPPLLEDIETQVRRCYEILGYRVQKNETNKDLFSVLASLKETKLLIVGMIEPGQILNVVVREL